MGDLLKLINSRSAIKTKLKRIEGDLTSRQQAPDSVTIAQVKVTSEEITRIETKYESIQEQIVNAITTEEDLVVQVEAGEQIDSLLLSCKIILADFTAMLNPPSSNASTLSSSSVQGAVTTQVNDQSQGTVSTQSRVRLPKLDLPSFEGNYDDWITFRDRFSSCIVNNNTLSGSEKLQYLVSCVKGEAAIGISNFPITNDSFDAAWKTLQDRYENTREIVFALIRKLMQQSKVTSENASHLRKLVDTTMQCLRSLENLGRPTDQWDDLIVYTLVEKMDNDSRREWARQLHGTEMPTTKDVIDFLEDQIRGLLASSLSTAKVKSDKTTHNKKGSHAANEMKSTSCRKCDGSHPIFKCQQFIDLVVQDRLNFAKGNNLCFNCLFRGHGSNKCLSKGTCRHCGRKHHTLLHLDKVSGGQQPPTQQPPATTQQPTVSSNHARGKGVILATALIQMEDSTGSLQSVRAFLDPGSESSFVTDKCASRLGLQRRKCDVTISGVGSTTVCKSKSQVFCKMISMHNEFTLTVDALVLPKVTGYLPSFSCGDEWKQWKHIRNIALADPKFYQPGEVDILIGADATERIFTNNKLLGRPNEPIARSSEFGWVILGPVNIQTNANHVQSSVSSICVHSAHVGLDETLQRFWELEAVSTHPVLTEEEAQAEEHFRNNHSRLEDGRYVIPLPFNTRISELGHSRNAAESRLYQVERRLNKDALRRKQYNEFMDEYVALGHMEEAPIHTETESSPVTTYYLPHHFVLKDDSATTKLRVVFDGSSQSTSGVSLNKCLLVGPTVQPDLFTHLLRFRQFSVAIKADIAKMYRQFLVSPQDMDFQRILWRHSPDIPIKEYRLKTVTYGTSSAPFSATRALSQLSEDGKETFPVGSKILRNNFYVDDLMNSVDSAESAITIYNELDELLGSSQLELRQWDSNCKELLNVIDESKVKGKKTHDLTKCEVSKALGVQWDSDLDILSFPSHKFQVPYVTRKSVLSEAARIFDPLGLLAPFTVRLKIFFQQLWSPCDGTGRRLSWDDPIPETLFHHWEEYRKGIAKLHSVSLPRCLSPAGFTHQELHTFSDASEKAYAAVVYLRSFLPSGVVSIRLVAAKTKVAPLKATSLPRLELCGAYLASKLFTSVVEALNLKCPVHFWTDSEITLTWISSTSRRWTTFVANRVAQIQELTPVGSWHFIPGHLNPADCASRGIQIEDLVDQELWWDVPILQSSEFPKFEGSKPIFDSEQLEERKVKVTMSNFLFDSVFQKFSTLDPLLRRVGYLMRFIQSCRTKVRPTTPLLTAEELKLALWKCCCIAQEVDLSEDLERQSQGKSLLKSSRLIQFNPFADSFGLIRVGGRIMRAEVPHEQKHQIILTASSHLTLLIVRHFHRKHHHAGSRLLQALINREFWILRGKNLIKSVVRSCLVCRRWRGKVAEQMMGNLPAPRVNPSPPFTNTGVDYAGPFSLKTIKGRGVKAVHLEVVSSQDTDSFIATFKRFISRRGVPLNMYSDCGSNFVGASKELKEYVAGSTQSPSFLSFISGEGITWHFNSPAAPHHGGLWESAVRQAKFHLHRVVGSTTLTIEEFYTISSQVEAALNSRPLTPMSDNPEDFDILTPGHFLLGRPILALPQPDYTPIQENRLSRWQRTEKMFQDFWNRWSTEYLTTLQGRGKWRSLHKDIAVGDLVAIKDPNLPPMKWKLGRVSSVSPGADGKVRVVSVKTATGEFTRPIVKLVPLLENDQLDPPITTSTFSSKS